MKKKIIASKQNFTTLKEKEKKSAPILCQQRQKNSYTQNHPSTAAFFTASN
jgi:hypothetical protein